VNRNEPDQITGPDAADMAARLARAEAALDAEREKVELLQRNLDDLRRMLPPPDAKPRRWWSW
jgi:multidrug resistance efflux pump